MVVPVVPDVVLPEVVPVVVLPEVEPEVVPVVAPEVVPEVVVPVVVEPLVEVPSVVPEVLVPVVVVPVSLPEVELAGVSVLVLVQEERAAPALKRRATTRMVQAEFLVCFIGVLCDGDEVDGEQAPDVCEALLRTFL